VSTRTNGRGWAYSWRARSPHLALNDAYPGGTGAELVRNGALAKNGVVWVNHDGGAQSSAGTMRLGVLLVIEDG